MRHVPANFPEYLEAVKAFAFKAIGEVNLRYARGERGFTIEEHIDRSKVRNDFYGRLLDLKWFQDLYLDIVLPQVEKVDGISAYAEFLKIPDPIDGDRGSEISEQNIMVYRLSVE